MGFVGAQARIRRAGLRGWQVWQRMCLMKCVRQGLNRMSRVFLLFFMCTVGRTNLNWRFISWSWWRRRGFVRPWLSVPWWWSVFVHLRWMIWGCYIIFLILRFTKMMEVSSFVRRSLLKEFSKNPECLPANLLRYL